MLIKPLIAFCHSLGIRLSIYLDDGRVLAASKWECEFKMKLVLDIFQRAAGWNIQWAKTILEPSQQMSYLGFITDSVTMTYSVDLAKQTLITDQIKSLLSNPLTSVSTLNLASLLGKIASLNPSHGNIVSTMTRSGQNLLGKTVKLNSDNWDCSLILTQNCLDELSFLAEKMHLFNGTFIPVHKASQKNFHAKRNR